MYDGALDDMGLITDPFTGSQYAFGAGNPVSNIENNGHTTCDQWGTCTATNTPVHVTSSQLGGPVSQAPVAVPITKNVIVQTNDPYYNSMIAAYNAYLKQCPACISEAHGNIAQQEWFWNNVCHPSQGQCHPQFVAALANVSPLTPSRDDQVFLIGGAFGASGFAEGALIPAAEEGGPGGNLFGPFNRRSAPQTDEEMTLARNGQLTELLGGVNRGSSFRSVDAHAGPLPAGKQGYEFYTPVEPSDSGEGTGYARWEGAPGVIEISSELVGIPIEVTSVDLP
jgi:hypothetical protein